MGEEKNESIWYRMRGMGLLGLCALLFVCGSHVAKQKNIAVSSRADRILSPVCCVRTAEKRAALTFETSQKSGTMQPVLDVLARCHTKASFFVTGGWAEQYPEEVRRMVQEGHDLGNHSMHHPDMTSLGRQENQKEIQALHELVRKTAGVDMKFFRAPYGRYDEELLNTVRLSGYLPVEWSVDAEGWKEYEEGAAIRSVTENQALAEGAIIRMYGEGEGAVQALEKVIAALREDGYELVPVSGLISWEDVV